MSVRIRTEEGVGCSTAGDTTERFEVLEGTLGMRNPIRLAAIANHHFDDVRLPFPPVWMQRAGLALGAQAAKLLGFTPTYDPLPSELAPAQ